MLAGDFLRKIRKLNRNLNIYATDDRRFTANIYHVVNGDYQAICGVDKNYLAEHTVRGSNGVILHGGWRRALKILISKGFIDRRKAEKAFNTRLPYTISNLKQVYNNHWVNTGASRRPYEM